MTSVPATAIGLSHRIGILREGSDADVVIWDSHPLQLGATPIKVWIDGVPQIPVPSKSGNENKIIVGTGKEGEEWKEVPSVPSWDQERKATLDWDGLPPLEGQKTSTRIVFHNVTQVWRRSATGAVEEAFSTRANDNAMATVVVDAGKIICIGNCADTVSGSSDPIDLSGGSIGPGLMTFGSPLGLEEIEGEPSTGDGKPFDALRERIPSILQDSGGVLRAVDALMFSTRNALYVLSFISQGDRMIRRD